MGGMASSSSTSRRDRDIRPSTSAGRTSPFIPDDDDDDDDDDPSIFPPHSRHSPIPPPPATFAIPSPLARRSLRSVAILTISANDRLGVGCGGIFDEDGSFPLPSLGDAEDDEDAAVDDDEEQDEEDGSFEDGDGTVE